MTDIAKLRESQDDIRGPFNVCMSLLDEVEKLRAALREIVERADEACSGIARQAMGKRNDEN